MDIENILSLNNIEKSPELQSDRNKQVELRCKGAMIELIQITHKILNISDQITFQTHIS